MSSLIRRHRSEDGASAVEYGLLIALIAAVIGMVMVSRAIRIARLTLHP